MPVADPITSRGREAIVVGAGPNGLAAAIVLARAGWSVVVREAADVPGGGVRSSELTLPGFMHDVGSAVHPLGVSSPLFRTLPLASHGLNWVHPPVPLAHPLDDAPAVVLHRSIADTAHGLEGPDARRYAALMQPLVDRWDALSDDVLAPLPPWRFPVHPLLLARFAVRGIPAAASVARRTFRGQRGRALYAGLAAHSVLPLTWLGSSAFALVLGAAAHAVGWPIPKGGSGGLTRALVAYLESLGGIIVTGTPVRSLAELPAADAVLLDVTPRQLLALGGDRVPRRDRRSLQRYRYGAGVFKVDWALSGPIPWRDASCALAATVHVGGSLDEIVASEAAPWRGVNAERPFVLLVQPTLFDPSRAPTGQHIAWAYCHVPHGSPADMLARIEAQVERFAPGFRDLVIARCVMPPARLEAYDANLVGGDIGGGANTLRQVMFRPSPWRAPYTTGIPGVYLCSSSTPPGGGVHGMCGYHAAQAVLATSQKASTDSA